MIPSKIEVSKHVVETINNYKRFTLEQFGVDVSNLVLKITFRQAKVYGSAGVRFAMPVMTLNLGYVIANEVLGFSEYASIAKRANLSSFKTNDWKLWVETLIAHEMAHVVQFNLPFSNSPLKLGGNRYQGLGVYERSHGSFFQAIYSRFRKTFINSRVTEPVYAPMVSFNLNDEQKKAQQPKKRAVVRLTHPPIGSKVNLGGVILEIKEYFPNRPKFAFVTDKLPSSSKSYKLTLGQVHKYLVK